MPRDIIVSNYIKVLLKQILNLVVHVKRSLSLRLLTLTLSLGIHTNTLSVGKEISERLNKRGCW